MEKAIILDETQNRIIIKGVLIKLAHAPLTYKDASGKERTSDVPMYQLCISVTPREEYTDTLRKVRSLYYKNAEENFIPKWLKADLSAPEFKEQNLLINFKSRFDLKHFIKPESPFDADYELATYDQIIAKYDAPLGSTVTVSVTCKDGALYPVAIRYDRLKTVSVGDYF